VKYILIDCIRLVFLIQLLYDARKNITKTVIVSLILKISGGRTWIRLIWCGIWTSGRLLWTLWSTGGVHKTPGITW